MKKVHRYELFVMAKGRWHSFRAVCRPDRMLTDDCGFVVHAARGIEMRVRSNHEVDDDEVDSWRDWVLADYAERTGVRIDMSEIELIFNFYDFDE